jgi:ATP-dependent RNA helicase DeaD
VTFLTTLPPLARALAERNFERLTPVQAAVLADDAEGRDLLVSAQTGSGKTVAYGLAMARNLLDDAERFGAAAAPLALIIAPTRELALQVHRELAWLYGHANARVVSCVGGMDPRREQRELGIGAHIVVGTPGRLCDHLRRGRLDVSELKAIVLDEADEMLDLGFREDIEFMLQATPESRRTLLFSATLPRGIVTLAKEYQDDAFRVEVAGEEGGHSDIEYRAIRIAAGDAEHAIVNLLRYFESPGALVFCNTREAVRHLQATLLERGFSVVALSGELTQNERTQALQALRDGRVRICVATDVAARGIDLPKLDLVIHADLPNDPEVMQHRSGRTGRAGRKGVSILLVPSSRRRRADMLLKLAGIDATWGIAPQPDEIRKLDQERLLQDDVFAADTTSEDQALAQALLADRSAEEVAIALARLYRARLPSPEDIADPGEDRIKSRAERARERVEREAKPEKSAGRHRMAEDSVWFTAAIGRRNNAEARWVLPMLCRRGSIKKEDLGTIRILETVTEFEVAARVASRFAARIRRPDKQDSIRIEAMQNASRDPAREQDERPYGKKAKRSETTAFDKQTGDDTKKRHRDSPAHAGRPHGDSGAPAKAAFGKKSKKKFRGPPGDAANAPRRRHGEYR